MSDKVQQKMPNTSDLLLRIIEQEKAAKDFGFYWDNTDQLLEQMTSEIGEIKEAILNNDRSHIKEEIGDLISAAVSLCIFLKLDPIETLRENIDKFQLRYDRLVSMVKADGKDHLRDQPMNVLMDYWNKSKEITPPSQTSLDF